MIKAHDPLRKELKQALLLYDLFGLRCLDDENLVDHLQKYRDLIEKTDKAMVDFGVVAACTACAARTGSCCFEEMAEGYGFLSLFANLLLGSEFPEEAEFPQSCRFVGQHGCTLKARHSFCLNYFCPDLKTALGKKALDRLNTIVGEQLLAGWELECSLSRWIASALGKS